MITTLSWPAKVIFGVGSIGVLGKEASGLGKKVLLVTGVHSARQTGLLEKVVQDLKDNRLDVFVFDKIIPNPRVSTIDEGAAIIRNEGLDLVIGLGGGSVMDTAKSLTLAKNSDKPIWEYTTGAVSFAETGTSPLPLYWLQL